MSREQEDHADMDPMEVRLEERAAQLARQPLLSSEVATALRTRIAADAHEQSAVRKRRRLTYFFVGLAAAVVFILFVLGDRGDQRDFGRGAVVVQMLHPDGRVLSEAETLRSGSTGNAPAPSSFWVELVAEEAVYLAVRIEVDGTWLCPWDDCSIAIDAGDEFLRAIEWKAGDMKVLVVASKQEIPSDLLDARLNSDGSEDLEASLGCQVFMRALSRERQAE